jgi:dihydroflavonol-4-reductase
MLAAVTGATGFIGSHLIDSLLERGWKIRILRHFRPPHRSEVEIFTGRIDQVQDLMPFCEGADFVFHLASAMGSALIEEREFYRINVEGTKALLEAARRSGVKHFLQVSSAGVLGAVPEGVVADEDYPPHPLTLYDRTKWLAEKLALEAARDGLDVVVVRPGWVYGPRDRRTFKLIRAIKRGFFFMAGNGQGRQTPVWIGDLVQGLLLAAEKGRTGEIYHLAGREILRVKEMAREIASACQVKFRPLPLPVFPLKLAAYCLDRLGLWLGREMPLNSSRLSFFLHSKPLAIDKAWKELGYSPAVNFSQGIIQAVRWYQEQSWL